MNEDLIFNRQEADSFIVASELYKVNTMDLTEMLTLYQAAKTTQIDVNILANMIANFERVCEKLDEISKKISPSTPPQRKERTKYKTINIPKCHTTCCCPPSKEEIARRYAPAMLVMHKLHNLGY